MAHRVSSPRGAQRVRTSMRLDKKLLDRLQTIAARERRSVTNLVEMVLEKELLKRDRADAKIAEASDVLA